MKGKEHIQLVDKYLAESYCRLPVVCARGKGVWIWDVEENQYLDMLS